MGDTGRTFDEVAMRFIEHQSTRGRDTQTALYNVRVLRRYFGGQPLSSITGRDIEEFITARLEEGVSRGTINRQRATLSRIFTLARRWGNYPGPNPVADVPAFRESPGRIPHLTNEQIDRLIAAAAPHLQPVIFAALMTGMRRGELLRLTWQDVDFERGFILVRREHSKSGRQRHVPMHLSLAVIMKSLKRAASGDRVFTFRGRPLHTVKTGFLHAARMVGLDGFRFHDLRHVFASRYIESGGDPRRLQEILGHSTPMMTQRYAHLSPTYLKGALSFIHAPDFHRTDKPEA